MKKIDRQLAANSSSVVHAVGTFIWLKSASGNVQIKTDKGETAVLGAGDFIRTDKEFTEFFVTDLSGAQNDLTFNTSQNGEAGKYGNVNIQTPTALETQTDIISVVIGSGLLLAANSNRNEAIIYNNTASINTVRIGDSNVSGNRGFELAPGATLFLNTTAAIYYYNPAATIVSLSASWTEF